MKMIIALIEICIHQKLVIMLIFVHKLPLEGGGSSEKGKPPNQTPLGNF